MNRLETTTSTNEPTPPAQAGVAVDTSLPTGDALTARYLLQLADDALIYAQRLGEWVANAPQIEEDMALANVSLDLLGQARVLLTRAGELDGTGRTEDDLAYFRDEREFRNVHLVEQPLGDFADEMARMLVFAAYQAQLYAALVDSAEPTLAGVAAKAVKEVDYHRDHATQWVLRLGDGTSESHERMQAALTRVMPYVAELFADDPVSVAAADSGVGVLPSSLQEAAWRHVEATVEGATLTMPDEPRHRTRGGRDGIHSRPMGYLLAEMQHVARSHPGATW
ncbi:ring-1,2-phenylacetyl-CoA epoxidase subunit PaaC [Kineosphaera limosa]|uniref:Phenylacetate-CoA oxygenase subunit PaaI n=1 Tax=Kineosphaera limosa NBRC 100340 TaxID=1184609 RepID=K6VDI9_9MICO|nr:1,2-phenylacetyl-CoA epoxidase subunit PaaC [Kineosphaera limosa]NYE02833.1 ring-1,2-phenylacetyl-CoA epoxidase subunit PaaC [Kineosphaera limosa]GAB94263.1 phenylacetate-CoA oxygenase subunit PaaI [Kineosphaera limosa NBRC 100340]